MPIQLNNFLSNNNTTKIYSPTFFSKKLTGKGATLGMLSIKNNPVEYNKRKHIMPALSNITQKDKYYIGNETISVIPVFLIENSILNNYSKLKMPEHAVKIGEITAPDHIKNVYVSVDPYVFIHDEIKKTAQQQQKNATASKTQTEFITIYRVFFWVVKQGKEHDYISAQTVLDTCSYDDSLFYTYDDNMISEIKSKVKMLKNIYGNDIQINNKAIKDYVNDFNIYEAAQRQVKDWQENIADYFDEACDQLRYDPKDIKQVVSYFETYNVPLQLYRNMYDSLTKYFNKTIILEICRHNLNLLLLDTLNKLENNKSKLCNVPKSNVPINSKYSNEQKNAIETDEPLSLIQAGAGTGKSTTILARVDYMIKAGIDPNDITVLSFTNAAANHITDKNPDIHSMTIARMIHNIYSNNFPKHELSSIETIRNSLNIYFKKNKQLKSKAEEFSDLLKDVRDNDNNAFAYLNMFIEHNYDQVIQMLDTIEQTSLELEIIICYQKIDELTEPDTVTSKHLIIDEVQDTSIFEFIYMLKYINKNRESLFMVGDASQSLYEFRSANPRALNVIENSGIFKTYQLQINYRSNQEILDFANIALADIEVNKYANIQLQANNITKVTSKSFTDKIHLHYSRLSHISDIDIDMRNVFSNEIKDYIAKCLNKNEQVACLAYSRMHVNMMNACLNMTFPNANIISLVPTRIYNMTIFSDFINYHWNEVKYIPTQKILQSIEYVIENNIGDLVRRASDVATAREMLNEWIASATSKVMQWSNKYNAGVITLDKFLDNIMHDMIQFEIRKNAIKQSLLAARNATNKQNDAVKNANILLSTIHSAKGLEFDNTVILYRDAADMNEEKKRMYYVALTRAMNSEFIYAYDTRVNTLIQKNYSALIEKLDKTNKTNKAKP